MQCFCLYFKKKRMDNPPTFTDFLALDIRVGTITAATHFAKAHKPAYQLTIDFGSEIGTKRSSAQLTKIYTDPAALIGLQIVAVVNFAPKQIANFISECLVLGAVDDTGGVTLLTPERDTTNGFRVA
jgi:tRNA-binding protein